MHCLVRVKTQPVPVSKRVRWVKNDVGNVWNNTITTITAEIIVRVAVRITVRRSPNICLAVLSAKSFASFLSGELTPAIKNMVFICCGGSKVNFDSLKPYNLAIDVLVHEPPSGSATDRSTSDKEEPCTLSKPTEFDKDLAAIHVGEAQILDTHLINSLPLRPQRQGS